MLPSAMAQPPPPEGWQKHMEYIRTPSNKDHEGRAMLILFDVLSMRVAFITYYCYPEAHMKQNMAFPEGSMPTNQPLRHEDSCIMMNYCL